MIATQAVTRYVTPLREGGSLPGLVEADDLGLYVCKFRGAGQGLRVLAAEVIVAGIASQIGVETPRLVALELDAEIARFEADEEVQDLLKASVGLNLGVDFLPGAFNVDSATPVDPAEAGKVLWLDAFVANVDRSWRNPNLLLWHRRLVAIDHGACLYFHHGWRDHVGDPQRFASQPWQAEEHIFVQHLEHLRAADAVARPLLSREALMGVLDDVPDDWLPGVASARTPNQVRAAYLDFLTARLASRTWMPQEAA
ncbi:HipA family kinase [Nocardioides limicola]|uniref:HipA family kinase n=1 Tax=Nocardioides limicola TaxID=2803368 RepID=UPI00193B2A30|nr:HipA family kinase [Nocardioides sp. DJM-14]